MPNRVAGGGWALAEWDDFKYQPNKDSLDFEEFYPRVHVYKNLLPNLDRFVEHLENSVENPDQSYYFNQWDKWHVFGDSISHPNYNPLYPELVDENQRSVEREYVGDLSKAFVKATSHYMSFYGIDKGDDWVTMGPSICRYTPDNPIFGEEGMSDSFSMKYHTDYDFIRGDEPGDKFAITCTMYLNDDYDGGELIFDMNSENADSYGENRGKDGTHIFKPSRGDIIVFPSGHPDILSDENVYYHAVGAVKGKPKYFIRSYWMVPFEGTSEWLANEKKYGSDVWQAMEDERIKNRVKTHEELIQIKTKTINSGKECGLY
jgi:hypothetical protein